MFSKKNISNVPLEETAHSSGSRKMVCAKEDVPSDFFEALTYGYLPPGENWSLHKHDNIVEICLVVKGDGIIKDIDSNSEPFTAGDRFIFPSDTEHMIENTSSEVDEFYFYRFRAK